MNPPGDPRNFKATAGNKKVLLSWDVPKDGGKVQDYRVRCYIASGPTFVTQTVTTDTGCTITGLDNGVNYQFRLEARNDAGASDLLTITKTPQSPSGPAISVTVTKIGPNKQAATRVGQSLADAPRWTVHGTNLDQPWGIENAALSWVLYTSTSHTTIVGHGGPIETFNEGSTSIQVTSPVTPAGADVDSNHLVGPWRLKLTYVPDPGAPDATNVVYSPDVYTTAVGTIVIGTANPNPLHDADTVTITGPDVGVLSKVIVTIGGVTGEAPTTRVDQNTATFVMPTFGFQLDAGGTIAGEYTFNGNELTTPDFAVTWEVVPDGTGGSGFPYTPPPAVDIPDDDYDYPLAVLRWIFKDPVGVDPDYTVAFNPDAMSTPFATRNITAKHTSAVDGQVLLVEGARVLQSNWQFSGVIKNARHYEMLRHWVEDRNSRTVIVDHYGREIECVLLNFNPVPRRNLVPGKYWDHTYTITALVIDVGAPTAIPA